MALDSPEMGETLAVLAARYGADRVVLRPTATKAWEYGRNGELLRADVSPLEVSREGRRLYCIPVEPREGGFWACVLYDEADNMLREGSEQLPA